MRKPLLCIFNDYRRVSFAKPLKETVAAFLHEDASKFDDRTFKEKMYVYFPLLTITDSPDWSKTLSDNKFSKAIASGDFSFLKDSYITVRQLLQVFGTEIMRGYFGDNLWILSTLKTPGKLIISDLRFKVEADAIKAHNGELIYISRPNCLPGNHASEKEVMELYSEGKFDHIITNDKDLKSLFNQIKLI